MFVEDVKNILIEELEKREFFHIENPPKSNLKLKECFYKKINCKDFDMDVYFFTRKEGEKNVYEIHSFVQSNELMSIKLYGEYSDLLMDLRDNSIENIVGLILDKMEQSFKVSLNGE